MTMITPSYLGETIEYSSLHACRSTLEDPMEMFKELRPNIVILDFQMPGINGIETARRMAEIAPAVPVVLFTQHASADLEKHAHEVGIRSVVSKTNAFPMVGMIQALLGSGDPETGQD